jgi:hypothetical protein
MNRDNVWMIECRRRPSFLFKSSQPLLIPCEASGQQLESYTAAQSRILCQINFTRPARAEQGHNLVRANGPPRHGLRLTVCQQMRSFLKRGHFDEALGLLVRRKQRLKLLSQRLVASARLIQEGRLLGGLTLQHGLKQLIDLVPAFRLHHSHPP